MTLALKMLGSHAAPQDGNRFVALAVGVWTDNPWIGINVPRLTLSEVGAHRAIAGLDIRHRFFEVPTLVVEGKDFAFECAFCLFYEFVLVEGNLQV